jgi:hypothetical protein
MKKFRNILAVIFFIVLIITVFFAIYIDQMFNRFGMINFINFLQIWAIFVLAIVVAEWVVSNIYISNLKKKVGKIDNENLNLKARMFDQEEEKKKFKVTGKPLPAEQTKAPENPDHKTT